MVGAFGELSGTGDVGAASRALGVVGLLHETSAAMCLGECVYCPPYRSLLGGGVENSSRPAVIQRLLASELELKKGGLPEARILSSLLVRSGPRRKAEGFTLLFHFHAPAMRRWREKPLFRNGIGFAHLSKVRMDDGAECTASAGIWRRTARLGFLHRGVML